MLGNRVIELGLGGAVSGPDMKQFLKDCFAHCKIIEGYGLSETGSVANDAGTILTGVEWKLVDVPQLGYTSQYDRDNDTNPRCSHH
jgi:long-subunit acyl-CoA synthetase (AMP-forming)